MDYNLLKVAYTSTSTTTGTVTPLTNQSLSYDNLLALIDGDTSTSGVLVSPQKYIGISSNLGRDFYCKEARIYVNDSSAGYVRFFHKTKDGTTWYELTPTWNSSGYYTHSFGRTVIGNLQAFYGNASLTITGTCYQMELLNWDEAVDFGTDGELPATPLELPYIYFRPTSLAIYNNNPTSVYAVPRVFVDSTGYYEADRIIQLSADYDEDMGISGTWITIDDGIRIPEDYDWDLGTYSGTAAVSEKIQLNTGTTSGYWQSPVIRIDDPQSIVLYAYGSQKSGNAKINHQWNSVSELLEVRVSDTMPRENAVFNILAITQRFASTSTPITKRLFIESDGSTICWSDPSNNSYGYSNWFTWPYGPNCGEPKLGTNLKIKSGFSDVDSTVRAYSGPNTSLAGYDDYYFQIGSRTSCTYWPRGYNAGSSFTGFNQRLNERPHSMVFFVPGSNSLWWNINIRIYGGGFRYIWHLANNWTVTRSYTSALIGSNSTPQQNYLSSCLAMDTGGIWVLMNDTVYKHNLYTDTPTATLSVTALTYRDIIPTGNSSIRGFWAIGPTCVAFFEHSAASAGTLTKTMEFTAAAGYNLVDVASASADEDNNLWISDRGTGHIQRINYAEQEIDFDLYVPFSTSVVASPDGRFSYVYVHSDQDHFSQDALYKIDIETGVASYIGSMPGVYTIYPFLSQMEGRVVSAIDEEGSYFQPIATDPVWGTSGSASWVEYPNASMGLPKGKYKQFRISLQRNSSLTTTPILEKVRVPMPLLMDAIPHHDYRYVYIDTDIDTGAVPGRYDINLLVFWPEV